MTDQKALSKSVAILHLTDFHLLDKDSPDEPLKAVNFKTYAKKLHQALKDAHGSELQIDALVLTGDFVEGSNPDVSKKNDCFDHAVAVISDVQKRFSVSKEQTFVCPGNHDLDRTADQQGKSADARARYISLREKVTGSSGVAKLADLTERADQFAVLTLDSTLGSEGANRSGTVSPAAADHIRSLAARIALPLTKPLIVLSHHAPLQTFDIAPIEGEDVSFSRAMWASGARIFQTLIEDLDRNLLWFSGDVHNGEYRQEGNGHVFVTGRFGTRRFYESLTGEKGASHYTAQRRQARLVITGSDGSIKTLLAEWKPKGHEDDVDLGNWTVICQTPSGRYLKRPGQQQQPIRAVIAGGDVNVTRKDKVSTIPSTGGAMTVDLALEKRILSAIEQDDLYRIGRFTTCESESTLAWIPIAKLLDGGTLLATTVDSFAKWLKSSDAIDRKQSVLLIGIDCWGALLASQISVVTGIRSCCIAGRVGGKTHTGEEKISRLIVNEIAKANYIFLVTDVIGTGRMTAGIYESLKNKLPVAKRSNMKWGLLSVICDRAQPRGARLQFASINLTACAELRIPVVPNTSLPSKQIFPSNISLSAGS